MKAQKITGGNKNERDKQASQAEQKARQPEAARETDVAQDLEDTQDAQVSETLLRTGQS
jgi:hypothetical protein